MALLIADKLKPKNNGSFALIDAADVEMPDGSRLSDLNFSLNSKVSWNDLTDKPFHAGDVLYAWNEETEYETLVTEGIPESAPYTSLVKISDDAPESDSLIGKIMYLRSAHGTQQEAVIDESWITSHDGWYMVGGCLLVITAESSTADGITLTRGAWMPDGFDTSFEYALSEVKISDPIVQIDEQFIPDTIARVSDIPEQIVPPVTSVNGQTGDVVIEPPEVSWNDLTDRPFGAEKVYYEWNEDAEYETAIENNVGNDIATRFVKVSDDAPDRGYFIGKSCEIHATINGEEKLLDLVLSEEHLLVWVDGMYMMPDIGYVVTAESITTDAGTFTKGIWAPSGFKDPDTFKISDWKIYDPIAQLDEQFIPDTIARKSDLETITIDQVDPDKVIFPEGLTTTYAIGNVALENGMATLVEPGGTLTDFFNIFVDEKNPSITQPSVSLTFSQAKAYEVGTEVTPSYSATLNPGSYTYGPATGVTATSWSVSDTDGNTSESASGSFPKFTVGDDTSYSITAKAQHGEGTIPLTNTKNEYPAGKIASGEKSTTSSKVTGFRKTFYGTTTDKAALSSDTIRGLSGKSSSALANGSTFTVTIPVGAMRVVIAYPATLRDVSSIKDVNGLNAEIASGFTKSTLAVEGASGYTAIDYKIYTLEYAEANDKANTYTVKI